MHFTDKKKTNIMLSHLTNNTIRVQVTRPKYVFYFKKITHSYKHYEISLEIQ